MLRRPVVAAALAAILVSSSIAAYAQGARQRRVGTKPAAAVSGPRAAHAVARVPFAPVERLDYTVDWNNTATAAQLSMTVAKRGRFFDREGVHVVMEARTIGFARFAATLDARVESYLDPVTLLPYRAVRESTVNGKKQSQTLVFERDKGTVTGAAEPVPIGSETGDILGLLYRFRAQVPAVGKSITVDGFEGNKRMEMRATVEAAEEVRTPAGTYRAFRVAFVPIVNGAPDDQSRIRAWFTDDAKRIPVLFTAEPRFGPLRIALASAALPN